MKKKFEEIREGARWRRYAIMAAINILFFALISVPMIWANDGVMTDLFQVAVLVVLFCFSLVYGFLSAELTGGVFLANVMFAIFGGIYGAFIGKGVVSVGDWSAFTTYCFCVWYFLRYSAAAFFVSLIVKNTK